MTLLDVLDRVDGAVLDIHLHDEAVYPLINALKARVTPYVFATGSEDAEIATQYKDVPQWTTPYNLEEFVRGLGAFSRR